MSLRQVFLCATILIPSVACLGCGDSGPAIEYVEGTVTMDGKPLKNATVVFVPQSGGRPAAAATDENGHYVLTFTEGRQGAMLGTNKIQISTLADPSETPEGDPIPAQPETVPVQYNAETTLTFEVKEGEKNIANFDLESGGLIARGSEYE